MAQQNGRFDEKVLRMAEEGVAGHAAHVAVPKTPRGMGNPGPLGLLCFGMTTVLLMFVTTSWTEAAFINTVLTYALFYGGFGQVVAGVLELVKGNTFAGTAFFSYGCFWMTFFLLQYLVKVDKENFVGSAGFEVGETLFMCLWGVFTALFFIPTLRKNHCLMTVFSSLSVTFFLLAGGVWSQSCHKAAGYVGFFCGCSAIYTAIAEIYQEDLGINMPGLRAVKYL